MLSTFETNLTIPFILLTGFIDGIHPCAIAILIFFIAFLLTLKRPPRIILGYGLLYILIIYLTYLAVGVGLLKGIILFGTPHFFAKLGAWLLILLGVLALRDYFFPNAKTGFHLPKIPSEKIKNLLAQSTLPTVALGAFFVALCSVPCSGGVYAAVTALLAAQGTFGQGFLLLMLYNLMFVLPLIIILVLSFNPVTLVAIGKWQQKHKRNQKLFMGWGLIIVGAVILLFFV